MFFRFLKALFRHPLLALLFPPLVGGAVLIYPILAAVGDLSRADLIPLVIAGLLLMVVLPLPAVILLRRQVVKRSGTDSLVKVADEMSEEFTWSTRGDGERR